MEWTIAAASIRSAGPGVVPEVETYRIIDCPNPGVNFGERSAKKA
jgi:hypothetical protein